MRLLARLNGIAPDDPRLLEAARAVGADVPVCLASQARIMRGVGERLSAPLALPSLPAVLINPSVPLSTGDVFANFVLSPDPVDALTDLPNDLDSLIGVLARYGNDLTEAAVACVPQIADVLHAMNNLRGVRLARYVGLGRDLLCFVRLGRTGRRGRATSQIHAFGLVGGGDHAWLAAVLKRTALRAR